MLQHLVQAEADVHQIMAESNSRTSSALVNAETASLGGKLVGLLRTILEHAANDIHSANVAELTDTAKQHLAAEQRVEQLVRCTARQTVASNSICSKLMLCINARISFARFNRTKHRTRQLASETRGPEQTAVEVQRKLEAAKTALLNVWLAVQAGSPHHVRPGPDGRVAGASPLSQYVHVAAQMKLEFAMEAVEDAEELLNVIRISPGVLQGVPSPRSPRLSLNSGSSAAQSSPRRDSSDLVVSRPGPPIPPRAKHTHTKH